MDISLSIGERIYIFRKRMGLSRRQLAEILDVTPQTVANYENGVTLPTAKGLAKIAAVLNVSMDTLLFDPDAEKGRSPILTQSQMEDMF